MKPKAIRPRSWRVQGVEEEKEKEEDEVEGVGEEPRKMKKMRDPKAPTSEERRIHELNHLPYRSWCKFCVEGRGKEKRHYKWREREDGAIPEIHVDYAFPASEKGDGVVVLVAKDRDTKTLMACVVPWKGTTGQYAVRRLGGFCREVGVEGQDIILKSDQEEAIKAVAGDLCRWRTGARTIVEHSPVGSSASNGVIERGIQSIEGMARVDGIDRIG